MKLYVFGEASQRRLTIEFTHAEANHSVLDFLRAKGLPIASSCGGEGICRACVYNHHQLSCQVKVKDCQQQELRFNYL